MKVLLINKFLFDKGGDARSMLDIGRFLAAKGHDVCYWGMEHPMNPKYLHEDLFVSYIDLNDPGGIKDKIYITANILYSFEAKKKINRFIHRTNPDIIHLNNFAHQISPSILHIFRKKKTPVVMTLHDYKIICASYLMIKNQHVCEACKGGRYYQCFLNKCTKNSYFKSFVNTIEMYLHHKILHIYDLIDIFISPSMFMLRKLREMGFKKDVVYLPNFIRIEDYRPAFDSKDKTVCYFGRLSPEKGIFTLIDAVRDTEIQLVVIGEGPLRSELKDMIRKEGLRNVLYLGYKSGEDLKRHIRESLVVVLPSECYENNPRALLEAFALGKPVIGSRIGGIPEIVKEDENGLTFEPGNAVDLREKLIYMIKNSNKTRNMGKNARRFVEDNFDSEQHYKQLMQIYDIAMERHKWKQP